MWNATLQRMCGTLKSVLTMRRNRKSRIELHGTIQSDCGVMSQTEAEVLSLNATI